jgi:hypothetical protein
MPVTNLNQLVLTGSDYKIVVAVTNQAGVVTPYTIQTALEYSHDIEVEDESIYAIGKITPIAEKSNAKSYKGKIIMQAGEVNAILLLTGLNDATSIQGCTLAISALQGAFARVFQAVNFNTENLNVKAKDKHTPISINWKGIGVNNN